VRGRFISLEGVDGSGKSTQANMLAEALRAQGREVIVTREPGGTPLGEGVRELLLHRVAMEPLAEADLFAASRAQHVRELIRPALERGAWVVSDRFVDSSLAYQGVGRGLGIDTVWAINEAAVDGCLPDLAIVIDVPPTVTQERATGPGDRIESEGIELQQAVAAGYRDLSIRFADRVSLVAGLGTPEQVHASVMAVVAALG
jgi:dTMP kinase